jgi:4-aminobutyrate aminotransferase-like enzyme
MALAQIREIHRLKLVKRSRELGGFLLQKLSRLRPPPAIRISARGLGLMAGVELNLPDGRPATAASLRAVKELLHRGYIFLPEGEPANVISFTPPLTIARNQLSAAVVELENVLATAI